MNKLDDRIREFAEREADKYSENVFAEEKKQPHGKYNTRMLDEIDDYTYQAYLAGFNCARNLTWHEASIEENKRIRHECEIAISFSEERIEELLGGKE